MLRGEAESLIANSTSGTRAGQSSARSQAKERRTSAIAPLTRSTLLVVLMVWRAEDERRTQRRVQVHVDLLTGRVWLVPTYKTATAESPETAARNFVGSVFRDAGLPGVLASDRGTRFTSAFWTGLQTVVAGAGDGQLEEVQADTPAAASARGDRQGVQQTGPAGGRWPGRWLGPSGDGLLVHFQLLYGGAEQRYSALQAPLEVPE